MAETPDISKLISEPINDETVETLFEAFTQAEIITEGDLYFPQPYYRWKKNYNWEQSSAASKKLISTYQPPESISELVVYCGLVMRLNETTPEQLENLLHSLNPKTIEELPANLQFEACLLLQAKHRWKKLQNLAPLAAENHCENNPQRAILTDIAILAAYRPCAKKLADQTFSKEDEFEFQALVSNVEKLVNKFPKNQLIYNAILSHFRGNHVSALEMFNSSQNKQGITIQLFNAARLIAPISSCSSARSFPAFSQRDIKIRHHPKDDDICLLVSTDERYFKKYSNDFIASYSRSNSNCLLHWHCVNFIPSSEHLNKLEKQHHIRINITIDSAETLEQEPEVTKGYYASARYIYLPEYLALYPSIAIADVDGIINDSFIDIKTKTADILLRTNMNDFHTPSRVCWEVISAGCFVINRTNESAAFAQTLSTYLCSILEKCRTEKIPFFYSDQIGLFLAYQKYFNNCTFGSAPRFFQQSTNWQFGVGMAGKEAWQKQAVSKL